MFAKKKSENSVESVRRMPVFRRTKKADGKEKGKRLAVLEEVTWPPFPGAVVSAAGCLAAMAVVGCLLWVFDYGVNQIIALIV